MAGSCKPIVRIGRPPDLHVGLEMAQLMMLLVAAAFGAGVALVTLRIHAGCGSGSAAPTSVFTASAPASGRWWCPTRPHRR